MMVTHFIIFIKQGGNQSILETVVLVWAPKKYVPKKEKSAIVLKYISVCIRCISLAFKTIKNTLKLPPHLLEENMKLW